MRDQADELRLLARSAVLEGPAGDLSRPRRIVVSGGKGGVGATTLAVNLAISLVKQGHRTVLADAHFQRPDVAKICSVEERDTIADVLAARRTVHEVLQCGPLGVSVLPGPWAAEQVIDCPPSAQQRLLEQLASFGPYADVIVLDVGAGLTHVVRRFWQSADQVLLVTSGDPASVMDSYAAIKVLLGTDAVPVRIVANMMSGAQEADEVHARIAQASYRFLGRRIELAGFVPADPSVAAAAKLGKPFAVEFPASKATRHIEGLAAQLMDSSNFTELIQPATSPASIGGNAVGTRSAVKMQRLQKV